MYVLLLAHRMLGILSDSRDRVLLLQRLQFHLTANCHQWQRRYPDLKECEALARLGLRHTDTVRGRLGYVLFAISVICHIACVHCVRALHMAAYSMSRDIWHSAGLFTNSLKFRNHARTVYVITYFMHMWANVYKLFSSTCVMRQHMM